MTMFVAGLTGAVFDALRRGPDILDNFTGLLRDSPYAESLNGSSMENAVDQARKFRNTKVMFGDVRPDYSVGRAAIATTTTVGRAVERLNFSRYYD